MDCRSCRPTCAVYSSPPCRKRDASFRNAAPTECGIASISASGRVAGIRLDSLPGPDGARISLDRPTAEVTLLAIRAELATGASLEQVLARFSAKGWTENTVEARLGEYLAGYRQRVAQGRRSPNTIRELERYEDRYYSWWSGRPMDAITTKSVEEFHAVAWRAAYPQAHRRTLER